MEKKRDWPIKTRNTRMITARLPLVEFDRLKDYCESNGKALTDVVRFALRDYLDKRADDGKEDGGYFLY